MSSNLKKIIYIIVVSLAISSAFGVCFPNSVQATGTTYYVSQSTGSDSNNGTSAGTPWKTLGKVSSSNFQPGDIICLKAGDTWNEHLVLHNSGTPANPIVLTSYGTGPRPRIHPGYLNDSWGITLNHCAGWQIKNIEIYDGEQGIMCDYRFTGSTAYQYLWVENCYFHEIRTPTFYFNIRDGYHEQWGAAVYVDCSASGNTLNGITIKNCFAEYCDGFYFVNDDYKVGNLTIEKCTVKHGACNQVHFAGFIDGSTNTLKDCVFLNNGGTRSISVGGTDVILGVSTASAVVQNNEFGWRTVYPGDPDGCAIDFEVDAHNIVVSGNYFHDNYASGIYFYDNYGSSSACTGNTVQNNLFAGNATSHISYADEIYICNSYTTGTITGNVFYPLPGELAVGGNTSGFSISGNTNPGTKSIVDTPVLSIPEGIYTCPQTVSISCNTPGAEIHYTTDGSLPTSSSAMYTGPITVDQSMCINAKAFLSGWENSRTGSGIYRIEPASSNLALYKTVTASSSIETVPDFGVAKAVDGQRSSITGSTGWTSNDNLYANHTEWITVDLGVSSPINKVDLYPRSDGVNVGYGFPADFSIKVSTDNINWTTVVTQTNYRLPSNSVQSFSFNSQNARYVKIEGTSLRPNPHDGNRYRMQFAEIEIYNGIESNMALYKTVAASSSVETGDFGAAKALDGQRASISGSTGWTSNDNLYANHTEWITVDLGASNNINRVDLYPRSDGVNTGYGFPVDFTIKVSTDNINWTAVVTQINYPLPSSSVQRFTFSSQDARYVKIEGTSLRPNPHDGNRYRMQFAEIEVYNRNNIALNKTVTASSSIETVPDFGMAKAVDGQRSSVTGSTGWTSNNNLYANHTEWITVDLGVSNSIGKVDLYPRNDGVNTGHGFPVDFTIQVSSDNINWSTVVRRIYYQLPSDSVQSFPFNIQNARYVKIEGTNLRQNPYDGNRYRMQFAEIEVY